MNKLKTLLAALLVVALCGAPALAANPDTTFQKHFTSTNTGDATDNEGAFLAFGGTVRNAAGSNKIETANVTSDKAGSKLYILEENGDSTTTDEAYSSGGKILPVTATTSFQATDVGAGSWVAIYYPKTNLFEVNRVSSITAGASLNLVRNTQNTYPSGATVYELTVAGSLAVGNATKDWPTISVYGKKGSTTGWYLDGTSACSINYIAGTALGD